MINLKGGFSKRHVVSSMLDFGSFGDLLPVVTENEFYRRLEPLGSL